MGSFCVVTFFFFFVLELSHRFFSWWGGNIPSVYSFLQQVRFSCLLFVRDGITQCVFFVGKGMLWKMLYHQYVVTPGHLSVFQGGDSCCLLSLMSVVSTSTLHSVSSQEYLLNEWIIRFINRDFMHMRKMLDFLHMRKMLDFLLKQKSKSEIYFSAP